MGYRCAPMWSRALVPVLALVVLANAAVSQAAARPSVTRLTLSPATFSTGAHKQTTFRFRLSHRSTVRISIARERAGRKPLVVGRLLRRAASGRVAIGWSGRLNRRALAPSKYRATLIATDARHRRSRARTVRFTIVAAPAGTPPAGAAPPTPAPFPGAGGFPSPSTTGVPA